MPASYRNQLARSTATGPKQPKRLTASSDRYRCKSVVGDVRTLVYLVRNQRQNPTCRAIRPSPWRQAASALQLGLVHPGRVFGRALGL
jgi:hypothetical protein